MRTTHHSPEGYLHDGDEFDCGLCRATLLEAFRAPAEPVRVPGEHCTPGETCSPEVPCTEHFHHPRPHLVLGPEHTRTVDMTPAHQAYGVAVPYGEDRPGGTWEARCSCGWSRSGDYRRDGMGHIVALRLAQDWAAQHLSNPLEGTEDA